MPYELNLESEERVILKQDIYHRLLGEPFFIAITDRALYFPIQNQTSASDSCVTERLPLDEIQEISARHVSSAVPLVVGSLVLMFGLFTAVQDFRQGRIPLLGAKVAASAGFILVGLLGREALVVKLVKGRRVWKVPSSMKQSGRDVLKGVFDRVLAACREAGLRVTDSRASPEN